MPTSAMTYKELLKEVKNSHPEILKKAEILRQKIFLIKQQKELIRRMGTYYPIGSVGRIRTIRKEAFELVDKYFYGFKTDNSPVNSSSTNNIGVPAGTTEGQERIFDLDSNKQLLERS